MVFFVEAHIGDGSEQALDHQPPCISVDRCIAICGSCQPNERARQLVLKLRSSAVLPQTPAFRYNRRSQPSAHTESKTFCDSLSFSSYFGSNHVLFIRSSRLLEGLLPTLHRGTQNPPAPRSTAYRGDAPFRVTRALSYSLNRKDCIHTSLCFFLSLFLMSLSFFFLQPAVHRDGDHLPRNEFPALLERLFSPPVPARRSRAPPSAQR